MLIALNLLSLALTIYTWIVLATVIASWLVAFRVINPYNPAIRSILRFLAMVTEPVLRPIRSVLPSPGGLDFSPIVLLLAIWLIQSFVINWLYAVLARSAAL